MKNIKAVVFDCDGVMFDTADANRMYYNLVLGHFNKPELTDEQFVKVHMFTVAEAIGYLFSDMESLEPVYRFMKSVGYQRFIPHMKMAPGLKRLLGTLSAGNYIRGVATNRTDTMATVLQANGLEASFDMVVTAADVARPKPEPDQLLAILTRFGLKPDEMVFIGDSIYDAKAAARAGVFFIAFGNPSLEADFQAGSMADVGGILKLDGGI